MNLIPWSPFDEESNSFPSLVENFFGRDPFFSRGASLPAVNVKEEDDKFLVTLAVPGMKKEDFKVTVENGVLTVSSEKKHEERKEEKGKYSRYEYNYSSFSRSFALPENADGDSVKAKCDDGELKITIGKKETKALRGRDIEIE